MTLRFVPRGSLAALPAVAIGLLVAACGGGTSGIGCSLIKGAVAGGATTPTANAADAAWPFSNGDLANTRDAAGSTITSANVSGLAPAWTFQHHRTRGSRRRLGRCPGRKSDRGERRRLYPGSRRERVRAGAGDRQAEVGVPAQYADEDADRDRTASRSSTERCTGLADNGLRARMPAPARRSGSTAICSARARGRSGSSRKWQTGGCTWRARTARGPAAGCFSRSTRQAANCCGDSTRVLGPDAGRAGCRPRLGRRLGDAAGRQRRIGDLRHRQSLSVGRLGDRASLRRSCTPTAT